MQYLLEMSVSKLVSSLVYQATSLNPTQNKGVNSLSFFGMTRRRFLLGNSVFLNLDIGRGSFSGANLVREVFTQLHTLPLLESPRSRISTAASRKQISHNFGWKK